MDKAGHSTGSQTPPPHASVFGSDADLSGLVVDDYRLLRRLGQGGMGQVYLAEQVSLRRQVALKIVRPELADSDARANLLAQLRAEAEAVARATHANIVQIYAIGQAGDLNYMALEYVEGRNLREFVEKKKPISASIGLKIMSQIASALQRAGELNMVHRDIKPENLLITRSGEVKVADFGLSRCFDRPLALTRSNMVMGTPLYMSPEQVELNRPVDHRSDLYAFGATSYFMFAGEPPFQGETPLEVAYQHVHKEPPPLAEIRPDLPAELCAMVHKMMAKQPEARYQTAREVARDIGRLREQHTGATSISGWATTGMRSRVRRLVRVPMSSAGGWLGRHRLGVLLVVMALVVGTGLGWLRKHWAASAGALPPEDGRGVVAAKEREKELRKQFTEHYKPAGPVDKNGAGLIAAVDLGLAYLEERRLNEADDFFQGLCPPGEKACAGRLLSQLGHAMVLAFQDRPAESNEHFSKIQLELQQLESALKDKAPSSELRESLEAYKLLWKTAPPAPALREMVARALTHNLLNDPDAFRKTKLEALRFPPRANIIK